MCCYAMHEDDVYCLKAIVREKDTASARASRLSTAVQVTYSRKKIVTIVRYALSQKKRYHLGIFPNMGGGVFPNPKTFVNLPSIFLYAKFILRC